MAKTRKPTHQAVCFVCYTCTLCKGTKKECEQAATSHINAYGHNVSVQELKEKSE